MPNDLQSLFDRNIGTFMERLTAENYKPQTIKTTSNCLVILQNLLCPLREKNLPTRADIEELREKMEARATDQMADPLPWRIEGAAAAASEMSRFGEYIGRRYDGKRRRI